MASYSGLSRRPKVTVKDLQDFATIEELRADPIMAGELLLNRNYHPLQKLSVWGMWFHPFSMIDAGRGTGKCMVGDSMVRVRVRQRGKDPQISYRKLEDLFNMTTERVATRDGAPDYKALDAEQKDSPQEGTNSEVWGFLKQAPVDVWSWDEAQGFTWSPILGVFKQRVQADGLIELRTHNGRVLRCTPAHRFLVKVGPNKKFIAAADLKVGQSVVICNEREKEATEELVEKSVMLGGPNFVYDLAVRNTHCYVANHVVTHNTAMASDVEYLSAMLYPGTVSLVISHSMRGVKLVFEELANHYRRSEMARDSAEDEPIKGSDLCVVRFKSTGLSGKQTLINGVAPDANKGGTGVRGQRCSRILHIDEWIFLPANLIDTSLMPCASNNEDPMAPPEYDLKLTRFIFTSSSGYTFEEAYTRMQTFRKRYREGDPDYFYFNANFLDMNRYVPGFVKAESVKLWEDTIKIPNPGAWEREIMARWSSESGSWYSSSLVKGNPEKKMKGMWTSINDHPGVYYERYNHEDMFVLGVDPAQQQDEAGYSLIKVTPDKLIIMRSEGIPGQKMGDIAEVIRWYMDHYNIVSIMLDPEQGGRAGVVPDLQRPQPKRRNKFKDVEELFMPVWPLKEFWMPNEAPPAGARFLVKYAKFSANAKSGSLTDMNETMRNLIETGVLVLPEDFRIESGTGSHEALLEIQKQKFDRIKEGYEKLTDQIIAIEATPIEEKAKGKGQSKKNVVNAGRFNFSTKGGIKKDRYSALLIAVWEAYFLQQSLLTTEEEDPYTFQTYGSVFDGNNPFDPNSHFDGNNYPYGM